METNKTELITEKTVKDINKYPIFRGGVKHQLGPHTVEEIDDPEWYELVTASLTGELTDDMTEEDV